MILGTNLTGDLQKTTQDVGGPTGWPVTIITFSGSKKLIIGPTIELQLPYRLSVEMDALYRRISSAGEWVYADGTRRRAGAGSLLTWEFPVLAKYQFRVRGLEPFVGLGPSFRRPQALTGASPYGAVAGAGVTFNLRHLRIAPAIRYTHWGRDRRPFVGVVRNQTEFLVGFSL